MVLEILNYNFSICKVEDVSQLDWNKEFCFFQKTDKEISAVLREEDIPLNFIKRNNGWKGFRINGVLDFSLVGIISKITRILARNKIGVFVVSSYNTDYFFVKEQQFNIAVESLKKRRFKFKEIGDMKK
ncbi:MAG: ACT domain-containing protein [bacterium]